MGKIIKRIKNIILQKNKKDWDIIFKKADCCCCVVKSLQEAIKDNHFKFRKIFERAVNFPQKSNVPALPVPISKQFLNPNITDTFPVLGQNNKDLID